MASARVVLVLLVCGVFADAREESSAASIYHPNSDLFPSRYSRPSRSRSLMPFDFSDTSYHSHQDSSSFSPKEERKIQEAPLHKISRYSQGDLYPFFIPINLEANPELSIEQQGRSLPQISLRSSHAGPPRLVMDKDFNIRFDNPYIVPVTKPLAFVLDRSIAGRLMKDGQYRNKMMVPLPVPLPVLVQSKQPLSEGDVYRDYRDEEAVEHRENYDEAYYPGESLGRNPTNKENPQSGPWKNSTSRYSETKNSKNVRGNDPNEEEDFNDSSDGPSVYPSKIFEEMYRNIPKYAVDSQESREHSHDGTRRKYSKESSPSPTKETNVKKRKARPAAKYSFAAHPVFSATSDLEWVTHMNSTKPKKIPNRGDKASSRIVIHEAKESSMTTTSKPLQGTEPSRLERPTTASPTTVKISEQFWREI